MAIPKVNQNFSLMVILTLHTFVLWPTSGMSLMVKCNELDCDTSQAFPLRLNINQDGSLIDLQGNAISFDNLENREITIQIPPDSKVPFATIERTLQNVEKRGIKLLRIVAPSYVFAAGQLFYAVPESNSEFGHVAEPPPGSPRLFPKGMQIQGFDMSVRPAQLSVDINQLSLFASGGLKVPRRYTVCVNAKGVIHTVLSKNSSNADVPKISEALKQVRVISPGSRNGKPVATAIPIVIPIK